MEKYYYSQLNKAGQNTYHAIKTGLQSLSSSFVIPRLEKKELAEIYFMVRLDNPEIFYSVNFRYRYNQESGNAEIIPEYLFDKNKIKEHQKAMKSRVERLVRPAMQYSELEKVQYIHDFICKNVRYDKLKKAYSHEIIGPLGQGVGVCEGIAKTIKMLCEAMGIWCIIAISESNLEKGVKYRHAWNIIQINGKYYHLDATFDNTLGQSQCIRYDYFQLSDKQIFRDHENLVWKIPTCEDGEHFYYKEKKLSFTKMEDVKKRVSQTVKKGETLTFHWRGGCLTKDIIVEMVQIFEEEAVKKEKHAKVSLNLAQAVIQVRFEKDVIGIEVDLEDVNEGESI